MMILSAINNLSSLMFQIRQTTVSNRPTI